MDAVEAVNSRPPPPRRNWRLPPQSHGKGQARVALALTVAVALPVRGRQRPLHRTARSGGRGWILFQTVADNDSCEGFDCISRIVDKQMNRPGNPCPTARRPRPPGRGSRGCHPPCPSPARRSQLRGAPWPRSGLACKFYRRSGARTQAPFPRFLARRLKCPAIPPSGAV